MFTFVDNPQTISTQLGRCLVTQDDDPVMWRWVPAEKMRPVNDDPNLPRNEWFWAAEKLQLRTIFYAIVRWMSMILRSRRCRS